MVMIDRRKLITRLAVGMFAAPAIVRYASLMPVKKVPKPSYVILDTPSWDTDQKAYEDAQREIAEAHRWVTDVSVFEPNDPFTRESVKRMLDEMLASLAQQGAIYPEYEVKADPDDPSSMLIMTKPKGWSPLFEPIQPPSAEPVWTPGEYEQMRDRIRARMNATMGLPDEYLREHPEHIPIGHPLWWSRTNTRVDMSGIRPMGSKLLGERA